MCLIFKTFSSIWCSIVFPLFCLNMRKFFISLGYSGWGPGQLEDEIKQNSWINIKEELDLLFDVESEKKWGKAIKKTGIDFTKFSTTSGNA